VVKYRTALVSILVVVFLVGLCLKFKHHIFKNSDGIAIHQRTIESRGALLLVGMIALGLLVFSVRRYVEKWHAAALPLATEKYVCTPAFQNALTRLVNGQRSDQALKPSRAHAERRDRTPSFEPPCVPGSGNVSATRPLVDSVGKSAVALLR
jgi:hypothetical protein